MLLVQIGQPYKRTGGAHADNTLPLIVAQGKVGDMQYPLIHTDYFS